MSSEAVHAPAIRLLLLGTGTHVGKTYVACALTRALEELGFPTLALKPIESGVSPDTVSDAESLARASGRSPRRLHCYALPEPLSPHLAARRAGVTLELDRARAWVEAEERRYPELRVTLIESAGGVFSPLHEAATNFELARAFGDALWVLVAPDALGVLHDLTACLTAMHQRGRSPDFVLLSAARDPDTSTGANADEIERLGIGRVAAVVRRDDPDAVRPFVARLAELVARRARAT